MTRSLAELRQYLAGEWLFDNDFQDTSGNGNHGTPTDIEWKPTQRGMKPRFNGSSSFVDCGNDSSLDLNVITISTWIFLNDFSDTNPICAKLFDAGTTRAGYRLKIETNQKVTCNFGRNDADAEENFTSTGTTHLGWNHIIITRTSNLAGAEVKIYIDSVNSLDTTASHPWGQNETRTLWIGKDWSGKYLSDHMGSINIYSTAFTTAEALQDYNETKGEYGVMPAEHSFTHNPDDVIDPSDAVGAWGTAKESTTELVDLSGTGNTVTIHGAMPAEGFIQGRRFTAANSNYLDCGNNSSLDTDSITIINILNPSTLGNHSIYSDGSSGFSGSRRLDYELSVGNQKVLFSIDGTAQISVTSGTAINVNKYNCLIATYDQINWKFDIDGVNIYTSPPYSGALYEKTRNPYIGLRREGILPMDGFIAFTAVLSYALSSSEKVNFFNTLARLPFWSVNYTDYPDNVTTYTDYLPYSSSIISSGTFKIDDDVLNCVSAGTITYRASYEFDGSEYIKVEIDGVEYAGTGTITQGNTTVSVAQGSNKITIAMGTANTINKVCIQFREEV